MKATQPAEQLKQSTAVLFCDNGHCRECLWVYVLVV